MFPPVSSPVTRYGLRGAFALQKRHASIKEIGIRIKSVGSIKKITSAQKMVAQANQKKDIKRMQEGAPFSEPISRVMQRIAVSEKIEKGPALLLGISGDKGMCGGVNTNIGKSLRANVVEAEANSVAVNIGLIGARGGTAIKRLFGDRFLFSAEQFGKVGLNFTQAAWVAATVMKINPESFKVAYNKFLTLASYETTEVNMVTPKQMASMDKIELSQALDQYTFEPPLTECAEDFHSFYYACQFYQGMVHGMAAEQSARVQAMENASSNAGDMLDALNLQYNKLRQAKITTELCEIVSGASAV